MKLRTRTFYKLTNLELYNILQLRNEVFVIEQDCVYQDADGKDVKAIHVFFKEVDEIVAYLRIFKPGDYFENASIGRVVVNPKYRGQGLGVEIMLKGIFQIVKQMQEKKIEISAQTYLKKFYTRLGFKVVGEEYLEDNIPHIKMIYDVDDLPFS